MPVAQSYLARAISETYIFTTPRQQARRLQVNLTPRRS
ncbi:hypothetical protein PCARR_a0205 [Pseudoalteromonas carrageenovora IAM 12662]|uniref:Uncharacterized protein n=1 Tax=Pseudoalteromonas carrageenovora IAM 12662 TaxID=1314868 RepID=A0ABR9EPP2_PSEVC|nr:hypothetical protein [Pseudoalteromonas carrageenovora IAM 12662]